MKKTLRLLAIGMAVVMICLTLASCGGPNSDPDKALSALKENGVTWAVKDSSIVPAALRLRGVKGVSDVVSGTGKIDDKVAHITIVYFDDAKAAKEAWEAVEKYADEKKDEEKAESTWVCKRSGKMIYFGTEDAVKAAK